MTAANIIQPRANSFQLRCTKCSSTTEAACGCGVSYEVIKPSAAAAKAVAANPGKTNRAIAEEIGVAKDTVARARKSVGAKAPTGRRTGKDGNTYKASKTKPSKPNKKSAAAQPINRQVNAMTSRIADFG